MLSGTFKFSTAATSHGCKHEDATILQYEEEMKVIHINFRVTKCGTIINKEYPFIHATPDFLCSCDCCGSGCGEVKCLYCIEGLDFDTYVLGKTSCLEKRNPPSFSNEITIIIFKSSSSFTQPNIPTVILLCVHLI